MIRTAPDSRRGVTLIELIVVITVISMLAALVVAFWPGVQEQQRSANGATMLEGWLRVAKARAVRDQRVRGLRLLFGNNPLNPWYVTQCQFLDQPDDFFLPQSSVLNMTGTTVSFTPGMNMTAIPPAFLPLDFFNGNGPAGAGGEALWSVQPGDYFEMNGGGQVHYITNVLAVPGTNGPIGYGLSLQAVMSTTVAQAVTAPPFLTPTMSPLTPTPLVLTSAPNLSAGCYLDIFSQANPTQLTDTVLIQSLVPSATGTSYIATVSGMQNNHVPGDIVQSHCLVQPTCQPTGPAAPYPSGAAPYPGTGTISASGSNVQPTMAVVTGVGTLFLSQVTPGNFIGTVGSTNPPFLVTSVANNTSLVIAAPWNVSMGPNFYVIGSGGSYRIIRAPRVVADEQLQLPNNIVIDLSLNNQYASFGGGPLPVPTDANGNPTGPLDILFSPSGTVITPGVSTDFLALWVRDVNGTPPYTPFQMSPTIMAVYVRSGLIAAHPPNDQGADPYAFLKDGRSQ